MLGGKPSPACGFALGVERVLEMMRRAQAEVDGSQCDVYVVHQGDAAQAAAFQAAERLRDAGLDVVLNCGGGSFKSQFKRADASGAFAAVVLGEDEVASGEATIKWLRGGEGESGAGLQQRVAMSALAGVVVEAMVADDGQ
jgi:histidyl-tRNA synthetase